MDIVRLEVISWEGSDAWDDVELMAPDREALDRVVDRLKEAGFTVIRLPDGWEIRDWAVEVLKALERIGAETTLARRTELVGEAAAQLTHTERAFLLVNLPDSAGGWARWKHLHAAASQFDPDGLRWFGDQRLVHMAKAAMRATRGERAGMVAVTDGVAAAVEIPDAGRRPAVLAVMGRRPPFLAPELGRLEHFARVVVPHLLHLCVEAGV